MEQAFKQTGQLIVSRNPVLQEVFMKADCLPLRLFLVTLD